MFPSGPPTPSCSYETGTPNAAHHLHSLTARRHHVARSICHRHTDVGGGRILPGQYHLITQVRHMAIPAVMILPPKAAGGHQPKSLGACNVQREGRQSDHRGTDAIDRPLRWRWSLWWNRPLRSSIQDAHIMLREADCGVPDGDHLGASPAAHSPTARGRGSVPAKMVVLILLYVTG